MTFNLDMEESRSLMNMLSYVKRDLESNEEGLEQINNDFFHKKMSKINYYFRQRKTLKSIQQYKDVIEILEELGCFTPSRFQISYEIRNKINSILPLLDIGDKERIQNVFFEGVAKIRENDGKLFEQINHDSGKNITKVLTPSQASEFLKILKIQERRFRTHNYLENLDFNNVLINEDRFISGDKHYLDMIQTLILAGKLKNKYIKNNYDKIKNAYISRNKAMFVNDAINDLLAIKDTTSNIDLQKLLNILNSIKVKNEKIIKDSENILRNFSEDELSDEYKKYMQEEIQKRNQEESIETYKQLICELLKAEKTGNMELVADLQSKIDKLKLSSEEKVRIYHEIQTSLYEKSREQLINARIESDNQANDRRGKSL